MANCPKCGFIAHPACKTNGEQRYVCERCGCVFTK